MHRVVVSLSMVFVMILGHPLGVLAQPARPETAADLLPADMFATEWQRLGARTTGSTAAATAQYGGPEGARIDLWVALTVGMSEEELRSRVIEPLFAVYQTSYANPETIESIGAQVAGPLPPCAETQRFEGFEFNYEFFPAGATVCILPDAAMVLIAFVGGEFEGLDGYRASDAVTTIVLDRIARDWDLPGSLSTPPATPMATPVSTP